MGTVDVLPGQVDAHANRHAEYLDLSAGGRITSDLTRRQRAYLDRREERLGHQADLGDGVERRRLSKTALLSKHTEVHKAIASGRKAYVIAALEDLASAALAYSKWIAEHGLQETRHG